ncbi:hypothetical protein [Kordiimonas lacus]|uniref:Uncharacterized protein n=1 Tax=Kordiimonas lacus TaxID=637679 RepID=A0A1G7E8H0_9PROT|nr:hypothetical protein [Kordiimonas lacus]SDE59735.1 hypothetical protein SAMN04488071_3325 [Kordiimonas lacus]
MIKKRQKRRKAGALNLRMKHLFGLILLSLVAYGAFRFWVGNPMESLCGDNCESMYSLMGWVLGFAIMLGTVILAGAAIGLLVAFIRRRSGAQTLDFAAKYDAGQTPAPEETPKSDTQG